ncbi:MAG TPA: AMP-binding protein [Rhodoblastus sp.]|nr:AMP-binding protein [Rhodoblastus sp.]
MSDANAYARKPWLALYTPGLPHEIDAAHKDALSLFRAAVARAADKPALLYFDGALSYGELDRMSDALAAALQARGFQPGDRCAIYMQNMPQFVIAVLGAWKAGGVAVPINPMNRERELTLMLEDCAPKALVCLDQLCAEVIATLPENVARPAIVLTTSALDLQTRNDRRVLPAARIATPAGAEDLLTVIAAHRGAPVTPVTPKPDDIAFLVYTSGTTGLPKAAMNTHANVAFNAQAIADWYSAEDGDSILGLAPLFHVTGLIAHVVKSWVLAAPLILCFRFEPGVVLDALVEHRPAFTVSAITAFIALLNHPDCAPKKFESLKVVVSGGAPIPPAVVDEFRARTGHYIHSGYGLTETNAGVIAVPHGATAPVDPASGALAIGVPKFNARVWIADESGAPAPVGEAGEIVVSGPSVSPGYWRKPKETADAMREDGFRTGDVAFMDEQGWFYIVDRKKDMIVASGFKVWPREVEDVLYAHPVVREAAVIGVSDPYRGETVKVVVSLKPGANATPAELDAHCRAKMAAYKRPQVIEIVDELPKTVTGKILRRMLR